QRAVRQGGDQGPPVRKEFGPGASFGDRNHQAGRVAVQVPNFDRVGAGPQLVVNRQIPPAGAEPAAQRIGRPAGRAGRDAEKLAVVRTTTDLDGFVPRNTGVAFEVAVEVEAEGAGRVAVPVLFEGQVGQGQAGDSLVAEL